MKLFGCTMVKNEEGMIPYVMPYVERLGYDKFVVYDDSSTDNTVAELKKYPFVEIRRANPCKTMWETDVIKRDIQKDFFEECWKYIIDHDNEEVWMTFTDFDEVIYCSGNNDFKDEVSVYSDATHIFYLNKPMVQIVDGTENLNNEITPGDKLVHLYENMRVSPWLNIYSEKVLLFKVNAVNSATFYPGNHHIIMELNDEYLNAYRNGEIMSFNNTGLLLSFHLKWINYNLLKKKYISTKNNEVQIKKLDTAYKIRQENSYPFELYLAINNNNNNNKAYNIEIM